MESNWLGTLLILALCQQTASGAEDRVIKADAPVDVVCKPADTYSMAIWFRVLDGSRMEFIGSFTRAGDRKQSPTPLAPTFDTSRMSEHTLKIKSFRPERDSGVYSCACINSNELRFGPVTRLVGEKKVEAATPPPAPVVTGRPDPPAPSTTACACTGSTNRGETFFDLYCSLMILAPLAGGCALLLLILIVTILYCNKIRTRRCPHHHKRKPRPMAPGKQMDNRHI